MLGEGAWLTSDRNTGAGELDVKTAVILADVLVDEDVPSRTSIYTKQELTMRSWGPEQYGW